MKKAFSLEAKVRTSLFMLLFMFAGTVFGQTTVTIQAIGSVGSYNTGSVSSSGTKNDGNMSDITQTTNKGWAKFDLSSIPSGAIVSSVKCNFTTYSTTLSSINNYLYGFTSDPSTISGTSLYALCGSGGSGTPLNSDTWADNILNTKILNSSGVSFIQTNLGQSIVCIGFERGSTNQYNIYGYSASSANKPSLEITYTGGAPCAGAPSGGTAVTSVSSTCSSSAFTLSLTGATAASGLTYQWQSSANNISWNNINGATATSLTTTELAATYYRCNVTCTNSSLSAYSSSVYVGYTGVCYCTSSASYTSYGNIGNVTFGSLNNGVASPVTYNTNDIATYTDYTNLAPVTYQKTIPYPISVSQIDQGSYGYNHYVNVFIDYNQDGTFDNTERAFTSLTYSGGIQQTVSGSVSIPATALTGNTRMRVILDEYGSPSEAACGTYSYGETEDYIINIIPAVPCSGTPTAGTAIASPTVACSGSPFTLTLSGTSAVTGLTYQWQSSSNNSTWIDINGAVNPSCTLTQFAANYYRCNVTCTNSATVSASSSVQVGYTGSCYCVSTAAYTGYANIGNVTFGTINNGVASPVTYNSSAVALYTDYTSLTPATFYKGQTYPISITQINSGSVSSNYVNVFIDYNQDGVFDSNTERAISGLTTYNTGGEVVSGNIAIPATALAGNTRMRVILDYYGSATEAACGTYSYGETEDYIINLTPLPACTGTPTAGTAVSSPAAVCNGQTFALSLNGAGFASGLTYQWQSSVDNVSWNNINGAVNQTCSLTQFASTYYRCNVTCSNSSSTAGSVSVLVSSTGVCYCVSTASTTSDGDIGNVTFGTLNNGIATPLSYNSNANNLYTDFTGLAAQSFQQTQSFPIAITQTNLGYFYSSYVNVFIDYNHDGLFTGANERVLYGATNNGITGGEVVSGNISIPLTALTGYTRMRIILDEYGSSSEAPCGTYTYGETEDYLINITAVQPCSGTPTAGTAITSSSTICSGQPFTLDLTGASIASGLTYQWQSSTDNSTWADISGATTKSYSASQTVGSYYRCMVTCTSSGLTSNSSSIHVLLNSLASCYCLSNATSTGDEDIFNVTVGSLNNTSTCGTTGPGNSLYNRYTDYSGTVTAPILVKSSTVNFSVQIGTCGGNYSNASAIFIDYNHDGDFADLGELVYGDVSSQSGPHTSTGTFIVPAGALTGTTLMRVINQEGASSGSYISSCGTYSYGETEDYLVDIAVPVPCNGTPSAGSVIASASSACSTDVISFNLSGSSATSGLTYQWQSSTDNSTWSNISSATASTYSTSLTATTYYRCKITCTASASSAFSTSTLITYTGLCYCVSTASYTSDGDIGNVTFGTLNNGNASPLTYNTNATKLYTDYTTLTPVSYQQGQSYAMSITEIDYYGANSSYVNVFIDYNQDGFFDINTEKVLFGNTNYTTGLVSKTITIPSTALTGNTRMRVILNEYGGQYDAACGTYSYGETEDYIINITPQLPCSGTPTAGTAVTSKASACSTDIVNLSLTGASATSGLTYQWKSSTDNITFYNIAGATSSTLNTTLSISTYFKCVVTCSGSASATSSAVYVLYTGYCYCVSTASYTNDGDIGNVTFGTLNNGNASPLTYNTNATNLYTDYTSVTPGTYLKGQSYPMSITQINYGSMYTSYVNVFIDYNQDGTFDANTEKVLLGYTDYSTGIISGSIVIPTSALTGSTRMRVILNEYGGQYDAACGTYSYGETEDYIINITPQSPCSGTPSAGTTITSKASVCSTDIANLSLSGASSASGLTYQWKSSTDNITFNNISGATNSSLNTTLSISTYFKCVVTCTASGASATSSPVYITYTGNCYCISTATYTAYANIGNVTFGALNNGSATPVAYNYSATNVYTDFTSIAPANYLKGQSYPLSVTQISYSGFYSNYYVNVFIDYNQDGIFDPYTERVLNASTNANITGGETVLGPVIIPATALTGNTRMRVILNEYGGQYDDACGTYYYGETEDYTINILPQTPCSTAPTAGNAVSSKVSACSTDVVNLSLTGSSLSSGLAYQWQASTDNVVFTNIPGGTSSTLNTTLSTSAYFKCIITCSASSISASSSSVYVLYTGTCYCISAANYTSDGDIGNVTLGTLNNGNASPASYNSFAGNTYTDFTNLTPPDLAVNQAYTISVSQISTYSIYSSWINVFIDYNHDGVFNTSTERAFNAGTTSSNTTVTGSILVPSNALSGTTRMRVIVDQDGSSTSPACGAYSYGETEDYLVNIFSASCVGAPNAGNAYCLKDSVNFGETFDLLLTNNTAAAGLSYQWEKLSGTSWVAIPGATTARFQVTGAQTTYYRCLVSCGSFNSYSSTKRIIVRTSVGINELSAIKNLTFYPNPTTGTVTINLGHVKQDIEVEVRSLLGVLVEKKTIEDTDSFNLDIDSAPGLYFLYLKNNKGEQSILKVVKQD